MNKNGKKNINYNFVNYSSSIDIIYFNFYVK